MPRVFLTCGDLVFCEKLRVSFTAQSEFDVCGEARNGVEAIKEAMRLRPDIIIIEMQLSPLDDLDVAEAIKLIMLEVPLFLVIGKSDVLSEKEALSRGVDAVFEKDEASPLCC
jgi:DNA-binding NarL/FixJ family response regulator